MTLLFRLVLGVIFLVHGAKKFRHWRGTTNWFNSIGIKPGVLWGTLVAFMETVGGALMIIGFFTQVAALALVPVMAVAFVVNLHSSKKFFGEPELNIILLVALLMLASLGSGPFALERYFGILF